MGEVIERNLGFLGFPDYSVDTEGNVWSLNYNRTGKKKALSGGKSNCGYMKVTLRFNCIEKSFFIHRLVAMAFIPNPNNLPEVNHKDEDKTNNNIGNLEWCTRSYNLTYGTRIERFLGKMKGENCPFKGIHLSEEHKKKISESKKGKKLTEEHKKKLSKPVNQYTMDGTLLATYPSIIEAERVTGVCNGHIGKCCKGIYKQSGGFIWKYS